MIVLCCHFMLPLCCLHSNPWTTFLPLHITIKSPTQKSLWCLHAVLIHLVIGQPQKHDHGNQDSLLPVEHAQDTCRTPAMNVNQLLTCFIRVIHQISPWNSTDGQWHCCTATCTSLWSLVDLLRKTEFYIMPKALEFCSSSLLSTPTSKEMYSSRANYQRDQVLEVIVTLVSISQSSAPFPNPLICHPLLRGSLWYMLNVNKSDCTLQEHPLNTWSWW